MIYGFLAPFVLLTLRVLSGRAEARRHLPDYEGQAIALRVRGVSRPFVIAVRDARFVMAPEVEPLAEIEGELGTFMALLFGKLDYDAAFFRKRISFRGSLPAAMRFKALFDHMTP
ncbi:MAG: SCP2 sterol-binding domain-containing protein [Coriobacteriia bacterium]|nr:SCP2 sterol-binding domain-containing protein [Coriobacteriia bacterium]